MNSWRIMAVVIKEWQDLRKNRMVLGTMVGMPLIFVLMSIGTSALLQSMTPEEAAQQSSGAPLAVLGMTAVQASQFVVADQYMFYILMVPMSIPMSSVAYSVVGEKESRSLEPLLATPVTTKELLVAKSLVAVIPATLIAWFSFLVIVLGQWLVVDEVVFWQMIRPVWTLGMALWSPMLALLTALLGVSVSARVKDVRAAQSMIGIAVLPIIALSMVALFGQVALNLAHLLWATVALAALLFIVLRVATRAFDRESILTRWI